WVLLGMLACTCASLESPLFQMLLAVQVTGYLLGVLSLWSSNWASSRLASALGSFLVLNAAAWLAFWIWISGRTAKSWSKVQYQSNVPHPRLNGTPAAACPPLSERPAVLSNLGSE